VTSAAQPEGRTEGAAKKGETNVHDLSVAAVEHRATSRFSLRAPVLFRWMAEGQQQHGAGFTRDISTGGACVTCDQPYALGVGMQIRLEVVLPVLDPDSEPAHLCVEGSVTRVSDKNEKPGFALQGEVGLASRSL
jgi:PilZ domain